MAKRKIQKKMKRKSEWGKNKKIAIFAIVAIVLLVSAYFFIAKPAINGYVAKKQMESQNVLLNALLSQLYQNGYIQIPVGEDVVTLVPYQPQQEASQ